MTTKDAPHGRGMAWATLLVSGAISLGVNLWHAFDQAHGAVTWWFAALAVMYGTAPVILAAFQSHSAAFVPMGKFRLGLTYVLMLLGMVLSIRAQADAVEPFAGAGWRWVFPIVVDLSAIQALITLMISARAMARRTSRHVICAGPGGVLSIARPARRVVSVASSSAVAGATSGRQEAASVASGGEVVAPAGGGAGGELAASGAPTGGASGGRPGASEAAESAPVARQRQPRSGAAKSRSGGAKKGRTRRSMTEWVELAEPLWHEETARLRRQPTGAEFAEAIGRAGLGKVSASTAKNIRMEILDRQDVPALDDLASDG